MTAGARPIRTLIVDDERLARASLRVLLAADPEIALVGECASAPAAAEAIAAEQPELVFLDIEMPRMSGFQLLAAVGDPRRAVVFVTAHDQYALQAFDVQAVDYLLKPFDDRRFARALDRAKDRVRQTRLQALTAELVTMLPLPERPVATPHDDRERIAVRDGERILYLALADLDWIGADDYYVQLHVAGKAYLLREPLRDLEARLDPRRFVRIHRSAIVAIDRIAELRGHGPGEASVRLRDGTVLKLSRSRRARLRAILALPRVTP